MKVSELTGALLDAWVAKALGYAHHGAVGVFTEQKDKPWCLSEVNDWWKDPAGAWLCGPCHGFPYGYSSDWAQGGPIIERERISLLTMTVNLGSAPPMWAANVLGKPYPYVVGVTMLEAGMRAFVASKFGEEVPE